MLHICIPHVTYIRIFYRLLRMCVRMCVCKHKRVYVCVCISVVCVCARAGVCVYVCTHVCMCVYTSVRCGERVRERWSGLCVFVCLRERERERERTTSPMSDKEKECGHTHTQTHTHTHAHHTHTHTHTLTHIPIPCVRRAIRGNARLVDTNASEVLGAHTLSSTTATTATADLDICVETLSRIQQQYREENK